MALNCKMYIVLAKFLSKLFKNNISSCICYNKLRTKLQFFKHLSVVPYIYFIFGIKNNNFSVTMGLKLGVNFARNKDRRVNYSFSDDSW